MRSVRETDVSPTLLCPGIRCRQSLDGRKISGTFVTGNFFEVLGVPRRDSADR
jgi:hypothetical protein